MSQSEQFLACSDLTKMTPIGTAAAFGHDLVSPESEIGHGEVL